MGGGSEGRAAAPALAALLHGVQRAHAPVLLHLHPVLLEELACTAALPSPDLRLCALPRPHEMKGESSRCSGESRSNRISLPLTVSRVSPVERLPWHVTDIRDLEHADNRPTDASVLISFGEQ